MPKFSLSHCASLYANAIANPFSVEEGVCLPSASGVVRPSQKVRTITRFIASVGTLTHSMGFAIFSPTLANDKYTVVYSNSSWAGNSIAFQLGSTAGCSAAFMNTLPYTNAQLTSGDVYSGSRIQGRIVSYGIRWRYIGTELNKGGRLYVLVHPDHDNLYNSDFSTLGSYKECLTFPCSRSWQETCVFAQSASEINYPMSQFALNNTAVTGADAEELMSVYPLSQLQFMSVGHSSGAQLIGGGPVALMFDGNPGNQYEFEVVQHTEYIGSLTQSMLTKSHADSVGFTAVQQAASGIGLKRGSNQALSQAKAFAAGLGESISNQSGFTAKKAGGLAGEMAFGYMRARSRSMRQYNSGALIRDL